MGKKINIEDSFFAPMAIDITDTIGSSMYLFVRQTVL